MWGVNEFLNSFIRVIMGFRLMFLLVSGHGGVSQFSLYISREGSSEDNLCGL